MTRRWTLWLGVLTCVTGLGACGGDGESGPRRVASSGGGSASKPREVGRELREVTCERLLDFARGLLGQERATPGPVVGKELVDALALLSEDEVLVSLQRAERIFVSAGKLLDENASCRRAREAVSAIEDARVTGDAAAERQAIRALTEPLTRVLVKGVPGEVEEWARSLRGATAATDRERKGREPSTRELLELLEKLSKLAPKNAPWKSLYDRARHEGCLPELAHSLVAQAFGSWAALSEREAEGEPALLEAGVSADDVLVGFRTAFQAALAEVPAAAPPKRFRARFAAAVNEARRRRKKASSGASPESQRPSPGLATLATLEELGKQWGVARRLSPEPIEDPSRLIKRTRKRWQGDATIADANRTEARLRRALHLLNVLADARDDIDTGSLSPRVAGLAGLEWLKDLMGPTGVATDRVIDLLLLARATEDGGEPVSIGDGFLLGGLRWRALRADDQGWRVGVWGRLLRDGEGGRSRITVGLETELRVPVADGILVDQTRLAVGPDEGTGDAATERSAPRVRQRASAWLADLGLRLRTPQCGGPKVVGAVPLASTDGGHSPFRGLAVELEWNTLVSGKDPAKRTIRVGARHLEILEPVTGPERANFGSCDRQRFWRRVGDWEPAAAPRTERFDPTKPTKSKSTIVWKSIGGWPLRVDGPDANQALCRFIVKKLPETPGSGSWLVSSPRWRLKGGRVVLAARLAWTDASVESMGEETPAKSFLWCALPDGTHELAQRAVFVASSNAAARTGDRWLVGDVTLTEPRKVGGSPSLRVHARPARIAPGHDVALTLAADTTVSAAGWDARFSGSLGARPVRLAWRVRDLLRRDAGRFLELEWSAPSQGEGSSRSGNASGSAELRFPGLRPLPVEDVALEHEAPGRVKPPAGGTVARRVSSVKIGGVWIDLSDERQLRELAARRPVRQGVLERTPAEDTDRLIAPVTGRSRDVRYRDGVARVRLDADWFDLARDDLLRLHGVSSSWRVERSGPVWVLEDVTLQVAGGTWSLPEASNASRSSLQGPDARALLEHLRAEIVGRGAAHPSLRPGAAWTRDGSVVWRHVAETGAESTVSVPTVVALATRVRHQVLPVRDTKDAAIGSGPSPESWRIVQANDEVAAPSLVRPGIASWVSYDAGTVRLDQKKLDGQVKSWLGFLPEPSVGREPVLEASNVPADVRSVERAVSGLLATLAYEAVAANDGSAKGAPQRWHRGDRVSVRSFRFDDAGLSALLTVRSGPGLPRHWPLGRKTTEPRTGGGELVQLGRTDGGWELEILGQRVLPSVAPGLAARFVLDRRLERALGWVGPLRFVSLDLPAAGGDHAAKLSVACDLAGRERRFSVPIGSAVSRASLIEAVDGHLRHAFAHVSRAQPLDWALDGLRIRVTGVSLDRSSGRLRLEGGLVFDGDLLVEVSGLSVSSSAELDFDGAWLGERGRQSLRDFIGGLVHAAWKGDGRLELGPVSLPTLDERGNENVTLAWRDGELRIDVTRVGLKLAEQATWLGPCAFSNRRVRIGGLWKAARALLGGAVPAAPSALKDVVEGAAYWLESIKAPIVVWRKDDQAVTSRLRLPGGAAINVIFPVKGGKVDFDGFGLAFPESGREGKAGLGELVGLHVPLIDDLVSVVAEGSKLRITAPAGGATLELSLGELRDRTALAKKLLPFAESSLTTWLAAEFGGPSGKAGSKDASLFSVSEVAVTLEPPRASAQVSLNAHPELTFRVVADRSGFRVDPEWLHRAEASGALDRALARVVGCADLPLRVANFRLALDNGFPGGCVADLRLAPLPALGLEHPVELGTLSVSRSGVRFDGGQRLARRMTEVLVARLAPHLVGSELSLPMASLRVDAVTADAASGARVELRGTLNAFGRTRAVVFDLVPLARSLVRGSLRDVGSRLLSALRLDAGVLVRELIDEIAKQQGGRWFSLPGGLAVRLDSVGEGGFEFSLRGPEAAKKPASSSPPENQAPSMEDLVATHGWLARARITPTAGGWTIQGIELSARGHRPVVLSKDDLESLAEVADRLDQMAGELKAAKETWDDAPLAGRVLAWRALLRVAIHGKDQVEEAARAWLEGLQKSTSGALAKPVEAALRAFLARGKQDLDRLVAELGPSVARTEALAWRILAHERRWRAFMNGLGKEGITLPVVASRRVQLRAVGGQLRLSLAAPEGKSSPDSDPWALLAKSAITLTPEPDRVSVRAELKLGSILRDRLTKSLPDHLRLGDWEVWRKGTRVHAVQKGEIFLYRADSGWDADAVRAALGIPATWFGGAGRLAFSRIDADFEKPSLRVRGSLRLEGLPRWLSESPLELDCDLTLGKDGVRFAVGGSSEVDLRSVVARAVVRKLVAIKPLEIPGAGRLSLAKGAKATRLEARLALPGSGASSKKADAIVIEVDVGQGRVRIGEPRLRIGDGGCAVRLGPLEMKRAPSARTVTVSCGKSVARLQLSEADKELALSQMRVAGGGGAADLAWE